MRETIFDYNGKEELKEEDIEKYIKPNPNYLQPIQKDYNIVYLKEEKWEQYNKTEIPKETITIGIQTDLGWGEYIDVVLNIMGNKLEKHALVLGTNIGFVESTPVDDPAGNGYGSDGHSLAMYDISPATATKITEIGWWCGSATASKNYEVGLYSDAGNNEPEVRLYVDNTNAKGTTAGWKSVSVDWEVSPNTAYWLAVQLDDTVPQSTSTDYAFSGFNGRAAIWDQTELLSDWGTSSLTDIDGTFAFYAVWEEGGEPPASTCTPPASGCWEIDNGDDCTIDDSKSLAGGICIQDGTLTITSTGTVNIPTGNNIEIKDLAGNWIYIEDGGSIQIEV